MHNGAVYSKIHLNFYIFDDLYDVYIAFLLYCSLCNETLIGTLAGLDARLI